MRLGTRKLRAKPRRTSMRRPALPQSVSFKKITGIDLRRRAQRARHASTLPERRGVRNVAQGRTHDAKRALNAREATDATDDAHATRCSGARAEARLSMAGAAVRRQRWAITRFTWLSRLRR